MSICVNVDGTHASNPINFGQSHNLINISRSGFDLCRSTASEGSILRVVSRESIAVRTSCACTSFC